MNVYDPKNYGPIRNGIIDKYIDELLKFKEAILSTEDERRYIYLRELYAYVKEITPNFIFEDDPARSNFAFIAKFLEKSIADNISPEFLLSPSIANHQNFKVTEDSTPEEKMDYIAMMVRLGLSIKLTHQRDIKRLEYMDLRGYCSDAAFSVPAFAAALGMETKVKVIEPGYLINSHLYMRSGDHAFAIVSTKGRRFLIDCTYSQFFLKARCQIEKTGILRIPNCQAGYFMTLNETRQKIAEKILKDGWIELTGDTLKHYLDGFTLSYRNGLYYERTGDFSYTTAYDVETCEQFISYGRDLLDFEDEETLGYQYTPLKNPKMKFRR